MSEGLNLDTNRFNRAMIKLAGATARDLKAEMLIQAKGVMVEAFKIMPPAGDKKQQGKAAQSAGERKIDRDLRGIFAPVDLKGNRRITHLFGNTDPQVGNKPPYTVTTKEIHPDVEAIYKRRVQRSFQRGRRGIPSRGQEAAWYVSRIKLEALAVKLKARVGWLAAGFNAAANHLGARIPGYAKRHGNAPGTIDVDVKDSGIRILMTNRVSYASSVPEIERRLQFAIDNQARKMERQIPHILRSAAKGITDLKAA